MAKKPPKKKPDDQGGNGLQMLQHKRRDEIAVVEQPEPEKKQPDNRRSALRMNAYIRKYEELCGNISATCHATGVSRRTYYRWIHGTAPLHLRFQRKIAKIIPGEKLVDAAEAVLLHHLNNKDLTAAIFTAKTRGRSRGWSEKAETVIVSSDIIEKVANAYMKWHEDFPDATIEEKMMWLGRFAKNGNVPPAELAKKVGISTE